MPTAQSTSTPSRAGRPRDKAYERRILDAGFEELSRNGLSHFSVSAVARRSGVAKGSVYLRWPTRDDLIVDSASVIARSIVEPPPGTFDQRLRVLAAQLADTFARPDTLRALLRIDADRELHPVVFRRIYTFLQESTNQLLIACIHQAQASGEIRSDVSAVLISRTFVGAMFVEALSHVPSRRVDLEFQDALVKMVLGTVKP